MWKPVLAVCGTIGLGSYCMMQYISLNNWATTKLVSFALNSSGLQCSIQDAWIDFRTLSFFAKKVAIRNPQILSWSHPNVIEVNSVSAALSFTQNHNSVLEIRDLELKDVKLFLERSKLKTQFNHVILLNDLEALENSPNASSPPAQERDWVALRNMTLKDVEMKLTLVPETNFVLGDETQFGKITVVIPELSISDKGHDVNRGRIPQVMFWIVKSVVISTLLTAKDLVPLAEFGALGSFGLGKIKNAGNTFAETVHCSRKAAFKLIRFPASGAEKIIVGTLDKSKDVAVEVVQGVTDAATSSLQIMFQLLELASPSKGISIVTTPSFVYLLAILSIGLKRK